MGQLYTKMVAAYGITVCNDVIENALYVYMPFECIYDQKYTDNKNYYNHIAP